MAKRWRPKIGDYCWKLYWGIELDLKVIEWEYGGEENDRKLYRNGLLFRTNKEAHRKREQILKVLGR